MRYCIVIEILLNPGVISFNADRVVPFTNIKFTYLMINIIDGIYVHVGIDIDDDVKIDDRNKCVLFPRRLLI